MAQGEGITPTSEELRELLQRGYRYALSLSHDPTRAEDLLQDAWVAVLAAKGPWHVGYLFTTIRNRFIDLHRREMLVVMEPLDDEAAIGDTVDERQVSANRDLMQQALASLNAGEREALYLTAVEGYTAQEVAEHSGRPRNTILSLMRRARRKLREQFRDDQEATG